MVNLPILFSKSLKQHPYRENTSVISVPHPVAPSFGGAALGVGFPLSSGHLESRGVPLAYGLPFFLLSLLFG